MAKYKDLKELSDAFKAGELKDWFLTLDNDSTCLDYHGPLPDGIAPKSDEAERFYEQKYDESKELYDGSNDTYILDQALNLAGIPTMEV